MIGGRRIGESSLRMRIRIILRVWIDLGLLLRSVVLLVKLYLKDIVTYLQWSFARDWIEI